MNTWCRGGKLFGAISKRIKYSTWEVRSQGKLKGIDGDPHEAVEHGLIRSSAKNLTNLDILLNSFVMISLSGQRIQVVHSCRQLVS